MQALIRPLRQDDEPFLWEMLYYAAHLQEDGERAVEAAKHRPELQKYVQGWGRQTDVGVLAWHRFMLQGKSCVPHRAVSSTR